jgi:hypothetical protein
MEITALLRLYFLGIKARPKDLVLSQLITKKLKKVVRIDSPRKTRE